MIVFDLECRAAGHRFEGWFGSSEDYSSQQALGLVDCPQCGSVDVAKAPMAPRLARKGNRSEQALAPASPEPPVAVANAVAAAVPPPALAVMRALAAMQAEALKQSRWVGDRFAEDVRSMHYGEHEPETVHGQATADEAQELLEEGIAILPLPFPVAPPDELN